MDLVRRAGQDRGGEGRGGERITLFVEIIFKMIKPSKIIKLLLFFN